MHIGATKVQVSLASMAASIGVLVSNLTTNEVCALVGCLYGCGFFLLTCYKFSNKSLKFGLEDPVPSQDYLRVRDSRIEGLKTELNSNNIMNNNNVNFIL